MVANSCMGMLGLVQQAQSEVDDFLCADSSPVITKVDLHSLAGGRHLQLVAGVNV